MAFILFVSQHRDRLESERKQLTSERDRNDMLNELIGNLSHDFRTPLTVINTSLYLLKRIKDPQKQQEKIDQIEQQTQRLNRLIDDVIAISRLEHGSNQSMQPVNINDLLEQAARQFTSEIDRKNLKLQLDINHDLPSILANIDQISQSLALLVENAVHYTDQGEIRLRTRHQHSEIMIEFRDTGIGISAADLPLIFDRFYRADSARSTYAGGTGLGLAIVRRVVELHNGRIEVESIIGEGSTFRVYFPIMSLVARHDRS